MRKNLTVEKFRLSKEKERKLRDEIKAFYLDERGEEIGIIEEQQILDLFYEKLAPAVYDKALDDARRWAQQQAENLQYDYYLLYCDDK